jgi:hypothetical protein
MICPRCSAKAKVIMALASKRQLPARAPTVFVQYRCEQGHYFITRKVFEGTISHEQYLTANEQHPDSNVSLN